ncbi:MAG: elongation factor P [Clostridiales bacterium]|nr:elongation factor P [Clostridiales bacterium]MBP3941394.1 elongation factor P [Christensenellaceae bacterium]MBR3843649.1 elongation factor P [Christensenellaceae bacterium]
MVSAGEFRKGLTVEIDGQVWVIVDFQHVKPGKGAAFVRTKIRNVMTGNTLERTFNPTEKFSRAMIERKEMQYSYEMDGIYYFMDMETYDQLPLDKSQCEDALKYVKEEMMVTVMSYKGNVFAVEPPNFVVLQIVETEPGVRGDTATSGNKPATLETGLKVNVPLFINSGEYIRIDTRTDEYMERANAND